MKDLMAIEVRNVVKKYSLYNSPRERFKEVVSLSHKSYHRDFYALRGISFNVFKGETVGIIGTNGSGKSTILKIITGVLQQTSGHVRVEGQISALLELGAGFNQEYTGRENIYLNGRIMGYSRHEMDQRFDRILEFAEIGDFIDQPVKTYSSGMFARLAFAVAINVDPDILIVDEALSVGDLFFQNKCFKKFEELKKKGVTILFVSHDISSVRQMCSRVIWIERGEQIIFSDSNTVCDMYMDMKRQNMNKSCTLSDDTDAASIVSQNVSQNRRYPKIVPTEARFMSDKLEILSCYFTDQDGEITYHLEVNKKYKAHIPILFFETMERVIAGFVLENEKGLPLFDINNYINQQQTISGKAGYVEEAIYEFELPRLMKGTYILSAAVAQGTQERHVMHTWLHGVGVIEIVNPGFNSSYIEIPAKIQVEELNKEQIDFIP